MSDKPISWFGYVSSTTHAAAKRIVAQSTFDYLFLCLKPLTFFMEMAPSNAWFSTARRSCRGAAMIAAVLTIGTAARAESVLAETSAAATQRMDDALKAAGVTSVAAAITSPLQWANIGLRPHFSYRYLYGDGIRSGPARAEKTSVHTVSPGMAFEIGSRWTADYTASKTFYSSDAFRDRLDHSARLSGATSYGDLSLSADYRFSDTETPLAETAEQTRQRTHQASLSAGYSLGSRTGLTSSISYSTRSAVRSTPGYEEWSFVEGLQYQVTPTVRAGINAGFGFVYLEEGADMSYVRPQATVNWQATDKVSLGAAAGWEERSFDDSDQANRGTPTYTGSLAYRPFETTTLVLTGSRGVSVSFFRDQITENQSWSLSLQQRLLGYLNLGVTYSWRTVDFEATQAGLAVSRSDDGNTLSVSLSTRIFERGSIGIRYQTSNYDSNTAAFAYDSDQYGAEFSYRF